MQNRRLPKSWPRMTLLASIAMIALPTSADANIRDRAKCASIELAVELGQRVSLADRKLCESLGKRASTPAPSPNFSDVQAPASGTPSRTEPSWVNRIPVERGKIFGIGSGPNLMSAYQDALVMIAAQLKTEIRGTLSTSQSQKTRSNTYSTGHKSSQTTSQEEVSQVSQAIVRGSLKDVHIQANYVDKSDRHHVLAVFDQAAILAREQAIVDAVFQALSEATERFIDRKKEDGAFSQEVLRDLTLVLGEVNSLGDTDMGKKARHQWRRAYRDLQALVKKMVKCIDVTGQLIPRSAKSVDLDDTPTLQPRAKLSLVLTCQGLPVTGAQIRSHPSGGLVDVPPTFTTNEKGEATVPIGASFGEVIEIGFTHHLQDVPGAFWLSKVKPNSKSRIRLRAGAPATIQFVVKGGTGREKNEISQELAALAREQWGTKAVRKGALLTGIARVRFPKSQPVNGQFAATVELKVSVTLSDKGGALLSKKLQAGGLARTASEARAQAFSALLQKIARMKVSPVLNSSAQ